MAFQAVPDTASVTFRMVGVSGSLLATKAQWTWHIRNTVAVDFPDTTTLENIANGGVEWFTTGLGGGAAAETLFSSAWVLDHVEARDLTVINGPSFQADSGAPGTLAGDPLSGALAMLAQFHADPGESPTQWWSFLPVGDETKISGNSWDISFQTAVLNCINNYIEAINDWMPGLTGGAFVGVSRYSGTEVPANPRKVAVRRVGDAVTGTLASSTVRTLVATQRDRRT